MQRVVFIVFMSSAIVADYAQTNTFPSGGNVGIGTTSPTALFNVKGYNYSNWITVLDNNGTSGHKAYFGYNDGATTTYGLYINGGRGASSQPDLAVESKFYVMGDGNVGIANSSPTFKLDVNGNFRVGGGGHTAFLSTSAGAGDGLVQMNDASDILKIQLYANGVSYLNGGNVGIGTISPTQKLSVNGNISAKKLIITATGWSDYVFSKSYKLCPLSKVDAYIRKNMHLPDIPSSKEVEKNGVNVGDTQALLLKKVEELTLYMIDMSKKNSALQKKNASLLKQVGMLARDIRQLKNKIK